MDQGLEDVIRLHQQDLSVRNTQTLRSNLQKLEEKCLAELECQEPRDLMKKLFFNLLRLSVELENVELSLILIEKLKLSGLITSLQSVTQARDDTYDFLVISYIADYFHLDYEAKKRPAIYHGANPSIFDHDQHVDLLIDSGNWDKAYELIDLRFQDSRQNELNKQLISFRFALQSEIDENYDDALSYYEKSVSSFLHSVRVIIKQCSNVAYDEVKKYCLADVSLRTFWSDYSFICGNVEDAIRSCNYSVASLIRVSLLSSRLDDSIEKALRSVPGVMQEFLADSKQEKWLNKRKLEEMISVGSSLSAESKAGLAELASHFHHANDIYRASSIYLCLNQLDLANYLATRFLDKINIIKFSSHFKSTEDLLAMNLFEYLNRSTQKDEDIVQSKRKDSDALFIAYIRLGLIDEALQTLSMTDLKDEISISQALMYFKNIVQDRKTNNQYLDNIDPELSDATLITVQRSLTNNQLLSTHVITIVIFSIAIFLLKLDSTDCDNLGCLIPKLETMFYHLSNYIDNLNFHTSDSLLASTAAVVVAVKEKLDAVSDSDIIREGFRSLVETIAGRCLMESRYKSAASLYSQIEDNVNAIKALMRTGDMDLVVNYSLSVRDITVNRITINYLKHLNADSAIIEDFITRSKS